MADAPEKDRSMQEPSADAEPEGSATRGGEGQIAVLRGFCMRAQGAECARCALACPAGAVSFADGGRPVIDADACTRCGICLGICDAFASPRITMDDMHERFKRIAERGDDVVVTCKENVFPGLEPASNVVVLPCLASLSPEFWTLVLAENIPVKLAADLAYCADCDRAGEMGEMLYAHAIETAEAATGRTVGSLDLIPEKENLLKDMANPVGVDRRSAFENLVGDVGDIASGKRRLRNSEVLHEFLERREKARAQARLNLSDGIDFENFVPQGRARKTMWPRRKMLLEAIGCDPSIAERVSVTVSRTDCDLCANLLACADACPTGARHADPATGKLAYDVRYCSGCGLCVSACPEGAVELEEATAAVFLDGEGENGSES